MERPSQHVEDYLKALYGLESAGLPVTGSALATRLQLRQASVSGMVRRLESAGLVRRAEGRGLTLTENGLTAALRVVRRHRLIETFLHRALGMPWDQVHDEAELLEHAVSDHLEAVIDASLGHPTCDPHGDPIPPAHGEYHERWGTPLDRAAAGTVVVVDRVRDDPEYLRYLERLHVVPGVRLVVERHDPYEGPTWVRVGEERHPLGRPLAGAVYVTVVGP